MAIAGKNYGGLMKLLVDGLPGFNVRHSHLHTVWAWKDMEADLDLPDLKGMRRVHVINFFTYQGAVLVKWKHYMSSDVWSKAVCVVPAADVPRVAAWHPTVRPKQFLWCAFHETKRTWANGIFTAQRTSSIMLTSNLNPLAIHPSLIRTKIKRAKYIVAN